MAIGKRCGRRRRIAAATVVSLAPLGLIAGAPASVFAQPTAYDHVLPPIPPPVACASLPLLAVDRAELHRIKHDTAVLVAYGTASNDRWTAKQLVLEENHDGTAVYGFVACPPDVATGLPSGVSAFVPNAAIGGIHRIVIRAETNQQVIDVDAARRVPDPWLRRLLRPPGQSRQERPG
jgi:hypothetical protein